ncbi:MAG: hypothetical protein KDD19_28130, partial [Phaeodactylibacter sp.]|nr:hypothetical protein [Phaeodactylibacter sp.]
DLLQANGYLERRPGQGVNTVLETGWAKFAAAYALPEELDLSRQPDVEKAIAYLEKALIFKGKDGLSLTVPAMPDAERELFQLELSLEEILGIPVHINRKKQDDGDPATR